MLFSIIRPTSWWNPWKLCKQQHICSLRGKQNAASQLRCLFPLPEILWKSKAWSWLGVLLDRLAYSSRKNTFWQWQRQWTLVLSSTILREWPPFRTGKIKVYLLFLAVAPQSTLWGVCCYHPHFTDKETEALEILNTSLSSASKKQICDMNPGCLNPELSEPTCSQQFS